MRTGTPVVEKCRLSEIIHFNQSISLHFVPSTLYNQTVRFICSGEFFSINLFHQCCPINFLRSIPVDTVAYYKHLSSVCDPPQTKKIGIKQTNAVKSLVLLAVWLVVVG